jgi:hypothetical protein
MLHAGHMIGCDTKKWWQRVLPKRQQTCTTLHGVSFQKLVLSFHSDHTPRLSERIRKHTV